jgi:putative flavoprotein involved in K+ transport
MTMWIDTVVIGAGQAGLNVSRALQMADIDHVVLERGRIGDTWARQRWDSFRLNTPNWANGLLGWDYDGPDPDGFMPAAELRDRMIAFAERFELPVHEQVAVTRVSRRDGGFEVQTSDVDLLRCRNVVVCSGAENVPLTPAIADRMRGVAHLHAAAYRRPDQLADGGVLVIGGGQTGGQLADELAAAGRDTYLSTSDVGSVPRRYRGRDIAGWMLETGVVYTPVESLDDPSMKYSTQPLMTGVGGGYTVTLHSLARRGVTLLGRLRGADGTRLRFDDDLADHAAKSLSSVADVCANIDRFIEGTGIEAPAAEPDDGVLVAPGITDMCRILELDLHERRIGTVLWATGFRGDFDYLDVGLVTDDHGIPAHRNGSSDVEGLWFCGFPWMRIQSSGLIYGSGIDAKAVVDEIVVTNGVRPWPAQSSV